MKDINELKKFYESDLIKDIKTLEEERKKIARKVIFYNIIFFIALILSLILFELLLYITFFLLIGIIFLWIYLYNKTTKDYKSNFKNIVIERIIKFIDNNLNYSSAQCIPESLYLSSKLFLTTPDKYIGDDYVYGEIDKTQLEFSEIHTQYETRDSKGNTTWHTIFKGIFFVSNFNKKFKGITLVLPDTAQKMFGNLMGNIFQSWNKLRGELIKMDDPEFEKQFVVYGSDQIEARYILSTSLMKRILDYKNRTKKSVFLSFIDNKLFFAISYYKNLFEPKLFMTLLNFNLIKEYYEDLELTIRIVEELNLNTRIWG